MKEQITLNKLERLQLINQFKILDKLYPDDGFKTKIKILEEGYEELYSRLFQDICDSLPVSESQLAINILNLYRSLNFSAHALNDDNIKQQVKFEWFDLHDSREGHLSSFCEFFMNQFHGGRFPEILQNCEDENYSCVPQLPKYIAMLEKWNEIKNSDQNTLKQNNLTREEILSILNV